MKFSMRCTFVGKTKRFYFVEFLPICAHFLFKLKSPAVCKQDLDISELTNHSLQFKKIGTLSVHTVFPLSINPTNLVCLPRVAAMATWASGGLPTSSGTGKKEAEVWLLEARICVCWCWIGMLLLEPPTFAWLIGCDGAGKFKYRHKFYFNKNLRPCRTRPVLTQCRRHPGGAPTGPRTIIGGFQFGPNRTRSKHSRLRYWCALTCGSSDLQSSYQRQPSNVQSTKNFLVNKKK